MNEINLLSKWYEFAKSDFEMGAIAFKHKKFIHALFQYQQVIEKCLKGLFLFHKKEQPPYIHDLVRLFNLIKQFEKLEIDLDLLNELNTYYIVARYPTYKIEISKLTKSIEVSKFSDIAEEFLKCLELKMK